MGYSNGQVQTQSEGGKGEKGDPGLPGIGFILTDDGNFDIDSKRLTDVAEPVVKTDAATKNYVLSEMKNVLLLDGTQSMKGNLDMENDKVKNKIINLANGTADNDAVNLAQLKSYKDSHKNNYHLQVSFRFYRKLDLNLEIFFELNPTNDPSLIYPLTTTNHNHLDLYILGVKNYGTDFGGYADSTVIEMRNDLPSGIYTVIFKNLCGT